MTTYLITRFTAWLILFTEDKVNFWDKITYLKNLLITFAPVAFALHWFNWWFEQNRQFANFLVIALFFNMLIGIGVHLKNKSFDWIQFFKKNGIMIFACVSTYTVLELLRYTTGDNVIAEAFKVTIQLMTLLFPISKVVKNIHILTNGDFPPEFFIKRLYNFEKEGNLNEFFNGKSKENE